MSRKPDKIIEVKLSDTTKYKEEFPDKKKQIIKKTLSDEIGHKAVLDVLSTAYNDALNGRR